MGPFAWLWIAWGAMFLVIEGAALKNRTPGDTLSEHVWKIIRLREQPKRWTTARILLLAGLLWLTTHLVWGTDDGLALVPLLVGA